MIGSPRRRRHPSKSQRHSIIRDSGIVGVLLTAAAVCLLAMPARAGSAPAMPDPKLTPGAIADTDPAIVCAPGYSRAHRVWRDEAGTLLKYGIPLAERNDYTDDDRVPVCLGGGNASPFNHWPQPWDQAEDKDRVEHRLCRAVCAGRMTLPDAQAVFLGDWRGQLGR